MTKAVPLAGLYKMSQAERKQALAEYAGLTEEEIALLEAGLSPEQADMMIENVVGRYALPMGIATNFLVNGREMVVPMVVEEPSIVAGASYAAKLARAGGGFQTSSSAPVMIGQIQVLGLTNLEEAAAKIKAAEAEILHKADHDPVIRKFSGGARAIECRPLPNTPAGPMLVVHLLYDTRDAMGANTVNTAVETIAPMIEDLTGGRVNLRILSNLADHRTARAECRIPVDALTRGQFSGQQVAQAVFEAWAFAAADPYRAATHNKGIMNGIDAVAVATGNDWRALEAGAHAYAARSGRYTSLTTWSLVTDGAGQVTHLQGELEMPMAVGTVGGATRSHPMARLALKILGNPDARTLAEIMVAVGLAQNFAAIRALATEGIQRGHMRLHARQVAMAAGAQGDQIQIIANRMAEEGVIREDRARELLAEMTKDS